MARLTLYLPDELRDRAKQADLNLSALLRAAVERELAGEEPELRTVEVEHLADGTVRIKLDARLFDPGG